MNPSQYYVHTYIACRVSKLSLLFWATDINFYIPSIYIYIYICVCVCVCVCACVCEVLQPSNCIILTHNLLFLFGGV
jgi:hypothetical protein